MPLWISFKRRIRNTKLARRISLLERSRMREEMKGLETITVITTLPMLLFQNISLTLQSNQRRTWIQINPRGTWPLEINGFHLTIHPICILKCMILTSEQTGTLLKKKRNMMERILAILPCPLPGHIRPSRHLLYRHLKTVQLPSNQVLTETAI